MTTAWYSSIRMLQILGLVFLLVGCGSSANDTTSLSIQSNQSLISQIADKTWLLIELQTSGDLPLFQFNPDDFIRQVVRFRSDDFYELNTICAQNGGFYSIDNSLLTVSVPMISAIIDCAPLPELTSANDTSGISIFTQLNTLFSENDFIIDLTDGILQLNTTSNDMLRFRECITDCFIPQ